MTVKLIDVVCENFVIGTSTSKSRVVNEVVGLSIYTVSCLTDLYCWLSHNGLCLNPSKSDTVLFGTQQRLRAFPHITSINIAGSVVHLSDTVTTLGVNLDQT